MIPKILITKQIFMILTLAYLEEVQSKEAPKYMVDIERFEQCSDYPHTESPIQNQKFFKINRTARAFSFETHLKRPMDESVGLKTELEKWGSRGWIQVPFLPLQADACNLFTMLLGEMWVDLKRKMGVKEPEKCPIPPGHYGVKNYIYDTSDLGSLVPFKGKFKYKAILMDMKTKEPIQCIVTVINVIEDDLNTKN